MANDHAKKYGGIILKKVVLLTLCLLLISLILTGCSDSNDPFEQKEYMTGEAQIEGIRIDVCDRQIEVSASADAQIHIIYFENSKETYDITVSDENLLTMTSAVNKNWTDYIGVKPSGENRKILIQAPDKLLDTLTLSTTNEDILLPELSVTGSISLSANNGNITFGTLDVGEALYLAVKNGDIEGTVTGSYDDFTIHSEIKKGESNLPDDIGSGKKTLNVSCNNGDVNIELASAG